MLIRTILITLFTFMACSFPVFAGVDAQDTKNAQDTQEDENAQNAQKDKDALKAFMNSEVVSNVHKSAYGYAIFPYIGKAGLGIGAAHGSGRVYKSDKKTGDVSMTQVSIGFQAGGQAYRQVIYFQDKRAFDDFTSGEFEFGAQAEAILITSSAGVSAGSEGTSASANSSQSEARYHKGMIVFTMGIGGVMYQAALGGQKYNYTPSK